MIGTRHSAFARSAAVAVGAAALAALVLPATGNAANPTRSWQPEVKLTAATFDGLNQTSKDFAVGSAADGTATAVWSRERSTDEVIEIARHTPGGSWSPPTVIDTLPLGASVRDIVVSPAGDATFSLLHVPSMGGKFNYVQTILANGTVEPLHQSPGAQLVGNANGSLMAVQGGSSPGQVIYRPAGGLWSDPTPEPAPDGGALWNSPILNMDSADRVYWVGYYFDDAGGVVAPEQIALSTWSPVTSSWSAMQTLALPQADRFAGLTAAGNENGDLVVGWADVDLRSGAPRIETVRSEFVPRGAATPRPVKTWVSQAGCWIHPAAIGTGVAGNGDATVVWRQCVRQGSTTPALKTAVRTTAAGAWGSAQLITRQQGVHFQFEVNEHGTSQAIFHSDQTGRPAVAYRKPPNGAYGAGAVLTSTTRPLQTGGKMTLSANSDATFVYSYLRRFPLYATSFE